MNQDKQRVKVLTKRIHEGGSMRMGEDLNTTQKESLIKNQ